MTKTATKGKTDATLSLLLKGIIAFGVICQLAVVWFVPDKLMYIIGLWAGIATACVYGWHLWWSLERNMTVNADNERGATVFSLKHSMIRYAGVALVLTGLWYIGGNTAMLSGFLGVMGVKAGAYMQPLILKLTGICDKKTDI